MEVDNRKNVEAGTVTTGQVVDWFANVARTDLDVRRDAGSDVASSSDQPGQISTRRPAPVGAGTLARLVERYQRLPSWVLLLQIFLVFAWGRSALAHAFTGSWWSGDAVRQFLASETGLRIDAYQFVLVGIVEPMAPIIAAAIVFAELAIAMLLLFNFRTAIAIGLGIFINTQLVLAGQVSPSVFFLVAWLGITMWHLETTASPARLQQLSKAGLLAVIMIVAFLAPAVRTLAPEGLLEDPAFVLIFLSVLTALALWWINRRVALANRALLALTGDRASIPGEPWAMPSIGWLVASTMAAIAILAGGFTVLRAGEGPDNSASPEPAAGQALGTFESPYPFGLNVTLSYNDLTLDKRREWRLQLLESVLANSTSIRSGPITDGRLAMARIRLTYQGGEGSGSVEDITFNAIGRAGAVYPAKIEGCNDPDDRLGMDQLSPGQAVEGWVCWAVAEDELSSLVVGVEAAPADGVLYMNLDSVSGS